MIPYGRQWLDDADIEAVVQVLKSDWLTTGPKVAEFEQALADCVEARYAVAVSSGTAALHSAMFALGLSPGDEVIVPPMTFAATANCVVFQRGTPVFVDVDPETLLLDPAKVIEKISARTKAIITVDYAGQPCNYEELQKIAVRYGIKLVADACHALGATYKGRKVGSLADMTVFSFHPVKHIATGEGGMIVTNNLEYAQRLRLFRNHGITMDLQQRQEQNTWYYEMVELGYNYRITDFQCALGLSQLKKLVDWVSRRQFLARRYDQALADLPNVTSLETSSQVSHAFHLYVVRFPGEHLGKDRDTVYKLLREAGIGAQVHYIPVHLHPYYRQRWGTGPGQCPEAEKAYREILSLPIFPKLTDAEQDFVIQRLKNILA